MERVAILLLLVAVASAYPYSPYTDHKGESKNVKLSEEAVAAYLKSKMEDEKLEPAKIMDYVETLLQGAGKGGKGGKGDDVTEAPSKWLGAGPAGCYLYQSLTHCMPAICMAIIVSCCCLSHFEFQHWQQFVALR